MFGFTRAVRTGSGGAFPDDMQLPPVVRVRLEHLPKTPPETDAAWRSESKDAIIEVNVSEMLRLMTPEELETMEREIKQRVLDKNMARISQWASGQRDNMDRPKIGHIYRKMAADDELVLDYRSHYGSTILDVTIRYGTWAAMLKEFLGRMNKLCAFIFCNSNQVIATPMRGFRTRTFRTLARYTQKSAGWGEEKANASQVRISQTTSVLLSEIKYDPKSPTRFSRASSYVATGVAAKEGEDKSCKEFVDTGVPVKDPAILNGNGSTAYTPTRTLDIFSYRATVTKADLNEVEAYGVSSSGERYHSFYVKTKELSSSMSVTMYDEAAGRNGTSDRYQNVSSATQQMIDDKADEISQHETVDWDDDNDQMDTMHAVGVSGVNGDVEFDYCVTYGGDEEGGSSSVYDEVAGVVKSPLRVKGYCAMFAGGYGGVQYEGRQHELDISKNGNGAANGVAIWSCGDKTLRADYGGSKEATLLVWPPSLRGNVMGRVGHDAPVETDWGTFDDFKSWLFVSNGDYTVVGIEGDGQLQLFIGTDAFSDFNTLAGGSVQCVWLDVPLSRLVK